MPLTLRSLIDKTLHGLGVSHINVELQPVDIVMSIDNTINLYNKYLPGKQWASLSASSSIKRYVINHRNLIDILDVQFMRERTWVEGYDVIPDFYTSLGEIVQYWMRREDAARFLSYDAQWDAQWEINANTKKRELALYVNLPRNVVYLTAYQYAWYREATDDPSYGVPSIPENDVEWIESYVLASSKYILGRILDKYKGVASPANLGIDGADLRAEAANEMADLKQGLISRKPQPPPLIG